MSTVGYPGMCARFQYNVFGGRNGWGFATAADAWRGQANQHPGELPPEGVAVPIWLSWDKDPAWHAAVSLPDGRVLSSPVYGSKKGQQIFPTIAALIAAFGGGMHYLGWAESLDGTRVVEPVNVQPISSHEEDDGMYRPTVHVRVDNGKATEWTRGLPEIGADLKPGDKRPSPVDARVTVFRGYEVTTVPEIGEAWARIHARGIGNETSRTNRAGYVVIQRELTRVSVEVAG